MKMKKNCELCKGLARMHCESDQASLCWSCDVKVHSANFLVARHSRTLLCHVCQSPTPWTASGSKLGPTISVCNGCTQNFDNIKRKDESRAANDDEGNETEVESGNIDDEEYATDEEDEEEDDNEEGDGDDDDDDDDIDNEDIQVVPWSPSAPPPPPPSAASSSSNGEQESYFSSPTSSSSQRHHGEAQRKRALENTSDLRFNDNRGSSTSRENPNAPPATAVDGGERGEERGASSVTSVDSLSALEKKRLKRRKIEMSRAVLSGPRSWSIIESVRRLHRHEIKSDAAIAKLSKLSEDPPAADHDSWDSS